jgi:hypothetical protein
MLPLSIASGSFNLLSFVYSKPFQGIQPPFTIFSLLTPSSHPGGTFS